MTVIRSLASAALVLLLAFVGGCMSSSAREAKHLNDRVAFVFVLDGVALAEEDHDRDFVLKWSATPSVDEADPQAVKRLFADSVEPVNRQTSGHYLLLVPQIVTGSKDSFRIEQVTRQRSEEKWQIKYILRNWTLQAPPSGHQIIVIPANAVAQETRTLTLSFKCFVLGTGLEPDPFANDEDDAVENDSLQIPDVTLPLR